MRSWSHISSVYTKCFLIRELCLRSPWFWMIHSNFLWKGLGWAIQTMNWVGDLKWAWSETLCLLAYSSKAVFPSYPKLSPFVYLLLLCWSPEAILLSYTATGEMQPRKLKKLTLHLTGSCQFSPQLKLQQTFKIYIFLDSFPVKQYLNNGTF